MDFLRSAFISVWAIVLFLYESVPMDLPGVDNVPCSARSLEQQLSLTGGNDRFFRFTNEVGPVFVAVHCWTWRKRAWGWRGRARSGVSGLASLLSSFHCINLESNNKSAAAQSERYYSLPCTILPIRMTSYIRVWRLEMFSFHVCAELVIRPFQ